MLLNAIVSLLFLGVFVYFVCKIFRYLYATIQGSRLRDEGPNLESVGVEVMTFCEECQSYVVQGSCLHHAG